MFFARPRLRTEGLYVSRNTYIKPGITDWENVKPVHLVCYYRYFRFFNNGEFISKTSPERLRKVFKLFKSRCAPRDDGVYHGGYRLQFEGDDNRLHLECTPRVPKRRHAHHVAHVAAAARHAPGRVQPAGLREARVGGRRRRRRRVARSVSHAAAVGGGGRPRTGVPPELRHKHQAVQRDVAGADFNRGLNTLVFVPWEHADDHVLNNSAEEMDFFVTG